MSLGFDTFVVQDRTWTYTEVDLAAQQVEQGGSLGGDVGGQRPRLLQLLNLLADISGSVRPSALADIARRRSTSVPPTAPCE